jgi:hypothetical protein
MSEKIPLLFPQAQESVAQEASDNRRQNRERLQSLKERIVSSIENPAQFEDLQIDYAELTQDSFNPDKNGGVNHIAVATVLISPEGNLALIGNLPADALFLMGLREDTVPLANTWAPLMGKIDAEQDWEEDLHQNQGAETIKWAALREVQEECLHTPIERAGFVAGSYRDTQSNAIVHVAVIDFVPGMMFDPALYETPFPGDRTANPPEVFNASPRENKEIRWQSLAAVSGMISQEGTMSPETKYALYTAIRGIEKKAEDWEERTHRNI